MKLLKKVQFEKSVDLGTGVCYASPEARANFEKAHGDEFEIKGDAYIKA